MMTTAAGTSSEGADADTTRQGQAGSRGRGPGRHAVDSRFLRRPFSEPPVAGRGHQEAPLANGGAGGAQQRQDHQRNHQVGDQGANPALVQGNLQCRSGGPEQGGDEAEPAPQREAS